MCRTNSLFPTTTQHISYVDSCMYGTNLLFIIVEKQDRYTSSHRQLGIRNQLTRSYCRKTNRFTSSQRQLGIRNQPTFSYHRKQNIYRQRCATINFLIPIMEKNNTDSVVSQSTYSFLLYCSTNTSTLCRQMRGQLITLIAWLHSRRTVQRRRKISY